MANYGDVSLRLTASWSRQANLGRDNDHVIMMVGHEDGTADAYRTEDPDAEHQFKWLSMKDDSDVTRTLSRGYELIHKDTWTKHPHLWRWNSNGNCEYNGMLLAARPANLFHQDEDRMNAERTEPGQAFNERLATEAAEVKGYGAVVEDTTGKKLKPTARR